MASQEPIYSRSHGDANSPLRHGEIVSNLIQIHLDIACLGGSEPLVNPRVHPFALVLSQDCDLEQDFKARRGDAKPDKMLPGVLFCEVFTAQYVRTIGPDVITSKIWDLIKINKNERYQFLQCVEASDDRSDEGLQELCIDFKRYFTIPTDEVYRRIELNEAKRRCFLVSPYLEHLSSRFAHFLCRVSLPHDHASVPYS